MLSRNSDADVNVIALVGERGREVREFVERGLGPDGLARSVVVVATSDAPALVRVKAALTAMTVAEAFRDAGQNVTLVMDSVTRTAMALREIGLAVGEPPTSRGYTPSVFAFLAPYLERAGQSATGSITTFATVLVEGDDMNDPVADAVRGILDGHIVLSRSLANRNHFPAVDVLASVSRLAPQVTDAAHQRASGAVREALATHAHYEDLITVGAYRSGQNDDLDRAMAALPAIHEFVQQREGDEMDAATTRTRLLDLERSLEAWSSTHEEAVNG
jgi:flagellum-specific ATP synthase